MIQQLADSDTRYREYMKLAGEKPHMINNGDSLLRVITDRNIIAGFENSPNGKPLGLLLDNKPYFDVVGDLCDDGEGHMFRYCRTIQTRRGGSVVIPVMGDSMLLVHIWRHGLQSMSYEFPRGFLDAESPAANAVKELVEETGAVLKGDGNIRRLGCLCPDSSTSDNLADVYAIEIESYACQKTEGIKELIPISRSEIYRMISRGEITDGYTLSALAMLSCTENN